MKSKSKYIKINDLLNNHKNAKVTYLNREVELVRTDVDYADNIEYWVAPKREIYTTIELNDYLTSLIPKDVEIAQLQRFKQHDNKSDLYFGYFDSYEEIGKERRIREITITDETINKSDTHNYTNIYEENYDIERRIFVRVFPSIEIANDVRYNTLPYIHMITPEQLANYEPSKTIVDKAKKWLKTK